MNEPYAAQAAAIDHGAGPALVIAGPGSGKTYTITRRLDNLIHHCHIEPSEILTITFTKAAANEMRSRAYSLIGPDAGAVTIGTFHSVFFSILKHRFSLNASNILKAHDKYSMLYDIAGRLGIESTDMRDTVDELSSAISRYRNGMEPGGSFGEDVTEAAASMYTGRLKELRLLDFDDMILKCRSLFEKDPEYLEKWRKRYRYIMVDEFQDISPSQYETTRYLAGEEANLFAVGDDDQAIYGFRGAEPGCLKRFLADHPGASLYELDMNYRCAAPIAESADKVIEENTDRIEKHHASFNTTGEPVDIRGFRDRSEEISEVIRTIDLKRTADYALLVRTNEMAAYYTEELSKAGIPVRAAGKKKSIYDTETAGDVKAYLRLASGVYKRTELLRVMNRPMRFISREAFAGEEPAVEDAVRYYRNSREMCDRALHFAEDIKMMGRMRPRAALRYLMKVIGYEGYLRGEGRDAAELRELYEISDRYTSIRQWLDAIDEAADREKGRNASDSGDENGVRVMTLHACKGLEFAEVFILDVNEGNIPYRRASLKEEKEEERRLFYVGMTRAVKKLHIFHIRESFGKELLPSSFLKPLVNQRTVP